MSMGADVPGACADAIYDLDNIAALFVVLNLIAANGGHDIVALRARRARYRSSSAAARGAQPVSAEPMAHGRSGRPGRGWASGSAHDSRGKVGNPAAGRGLGRQSVQTGANKVADSTCR